MNIILYAHKPWVKHSEVIFIKLIHSLNKKLWRKNDAMRTVSLTGSI